MTDPIITETSPSPKRAIIWLHGLGADGNDFAPIVPALHVPDARFIFPHAPIRPITLNGGMEMRGWYDILGMDRNAQQDEAGVLESVAFVHGLIDEQIAQGIAPENISVAGFSQGGAIALYAGLTYAKRIKQVIALSTYLPLATGFAKAARSANQDTPVLIVHGSRDDVVPMAFAEFSHEHLNKLGHDITWQTYPMAHSVCDEEIRLISSWLQG
jgi:phospholipase/carboxylesterase